MAIITRVSRFTGKVNKMEVGVEESRVVNWLLTPLDMRPYVQDAFPELTAEEREFILTGTTPEEWNQMFGEEEK